MFIELCIRIITSLKRKSLYKSLNNYGHNFSCDPSTRILLAEHFNAGDNVFIGEQSYISAKLTIENDFMCGPRVLILGGSHHFGVLGRKTRFLKQDPVKPIEPIIIKEDVWIGACSTIIGPLSIGMGAVIGANSIVTKDIAPYTVNVGSPTTAIKLIFSDDDLYEHLLFQGLDELLIKGIISDRQTKTKDLNLKVMNKTETYWENNVFK